MTKFYLNSYVKGYVEWELEHYRDNEKQLESYKNSLMPSSISNYNLNSGGKGGMSNPTEKAAVKMADSVYIQTLERNIAAIGRALKKCDETDYKLIDLVYWRNTHTIPGAALKVNLSIPGAYKRINKILCSLALEMGLINVV